MVAVAVEVAVEGVVVVVKAMVKVVGMAWEVDLVEVEVEVVKEVMMKKITKDMDVEKAVDMAEIVVLM